jgi:low affinity Fe/Cu permease
MSDAFRRFANTLSAVLGTHWAFVSALAVVLVWATLGPMFHWSDTWQMVINTGTTIVTFLMVFIVQSTQNRDGHAIHLKLDELIRAQRSARNQLANIEDASEEELAVLAEEFRQLHLHAATKLQKVRFVAARTSRLCASGETAGPGRMGGFSPGRVVPLSPHSSARSLHRSHVSLTAS